MSNPASMPLCYSSTAQLLIIDAQERLAAAMSPDELARVETNMLRLVTAAKILNIPIITTEHNSAGLGKTISKVREQLPAQVVATEKSCFSCCTAAGFERNLTNEPKRKQVVMVGMEAHICIMQTASGLLRWGYQVFVAEDAICSRHTTHRDNAIQRMRHAGIQIVNTESVAFEWVGDSNSENFRAVWELFRHT
ncbi:isochorismatase family protein [Rhodoferax sp. 4810]|uniref:Isochorismatase family protein n=1 Tax=Thiospirillum jenense TaxID=1653858 RepID=A0A839HJY6_9GAMM|nr:isochorismatase family protein [Thiospirillum jenense]MBB1075460.1 isochorismatase family protein [Rhodoferax jenense]MBB1126839.1 isochorismatase family protein [Thiospirillum jenense]